MNEVIPFLPYWRNESSGKLAEAVHAYFDVAETGKRKLTQVQILLLKEYIKIWANYPWKNPENDFSELQELAEEIDSVEDIDHWIGLALVDGIDPF